MDRLRITEDDIDEQIVTGGGAASLTGPGAPPPDVLGRAAGIGEWLKGFKTSAMNVLNYTTYYEMKTRAGIVGSKGVATMIDDLGASVKNIHLIGHSFGGRVVTAAAAASHTEKIRSMSLLQAAFFARWLFRDYARCLPQRRGPETGERANPRHPHHQ
jgi:pimeloyl-ACP methyl ester carboxylesterase